MAIPPPVVPPSAAPDDDQRWLYDHAVKAMDLAYARYSQFPVGAALITTDMGDLTDRPAPVTAANIENGSYGLTICAERSAVVKAIADDRCPQAVEAAHSASIGGASATNPHCITAIAVATSDRVKTGSPCGACRQVLAEFMTEDAALIMRLDYEVRAVRFADLLPGAFVV
jgi:homotetrameric cytidine deaminase